MRFLINPPRCLFLLMLIMAISVRPLKAQWTQTAGPSANDVLSLAVSGTNLFAGTNVGGAFLSTNEGTSWTALDTGPSLPLVIALDVFSNGAGVTEVAAGGNGLNLSTNNGASWTATDFGHFYGLVVCLNHFPNGTRGTNLLAGTEMGGVFLSTNEGTTWARVNAGLGLASYPEIRDTTYETVYALAIMGMNIFAGTDRSVYLSTDVGANWSSVAFKDTGAFCFAVSGTNLCAGTETGVFVSSNTGTTWIKSGLANTPVLCLGVEGHNVFAGSSDAGVFLSTNDGTTWKPVNDGLAYTQVNALAISSTYLFVGMSNGGVWRRSLSEMTAVQTNSMSVPTSFNLSQNYPNPFNPTTSIQFTIPTRTNVSLKVFDVLGREVATIVAEDLNAGTYSRQWNGGVLATGIYLYRLQAGAYTATKRLVLLR